MTKLFALATSVAVACAIVAAGAASAPRALTTLISKSSVGAQGKYDSYAVGISAGGRYVAFTSDAPNLVPGDTNERRDAFVRDRKTGRTTRVSVSSSGAQAEPGSDPWGGSNAAGISGDGRYVVFVSDAPNLVAHDTNGAADVFVRDRKLGRTVRVSVGSGSRQANAPSGFASISADGRYVAFTSGASNLVAHDTNHFADVFVRDLKTGLTTRVSVDNRGRQARRGGSSEPALSADGRYVAFASDAPNLVAGDTNGLSDVFVRDRKSGQTARVSVRSDGKQALRDRTRNGSNGPSISADGRYVAFHSRASDLVPGDTNWAFDIFVRDRFARTTKRVSVASRGTQANAESLGPPSIGPDGRYVAFASLASNLVPGDANDITDVFVHDLRTGRTILGSLGGGGVQGSDGSAPAVGAFNANDRYLAFSSYASNLVPHDTNGCTDAFVRDFGRTLRSFR
jgi:Tol biopolymer transport system component